MATQNVPLKVVAVSRDVSLLHEVSWMLDAVGYSVQTATDYGEEALWRKYASADLLVIDARGVQEPCSQTFVTDSENPTFRIVLYDTTKPTDFAGWFAAGAHDAIRLPLSRGELLARARTGARYLEFERRLQRRSLRAPIPGVFSRHGFLQKLSKLALYDDTNAVPCTLLVTAIDWFADVRRRRGETAVQTLENSVARAIRRAVGEKAILGYLGEGRFATLLVGKELSAAKLLAEVFAKDFTSRESRHESVPRPTLSSAAVSYTADTAPNQSLHEALELLDLAAYSGQDCVLVQGDFSQHIAEWQEAMSTGNPFANVIALDIMEPFPVLSHSNALDREADKLLHRTGLPVSPYVDHCGKLKHVVTNADSLRDARFDNDINQPTDDPATPETIPFDASFPEIYEAFSSRGCATLIVTHEERPLGYLTCDSFLSLIDPIDIESFSPADNPVDDISGLVVPTMAAPLLAAEALNV